MDQTGSRVVQPVHRAIATKTAVVTNNTQVTTSRLGFGNIILIHMGQIAAERPYARHSLLSSYGWYVSEKSLIEMRRGVSFVCAVN